MTKGFAETERATLAFENLPEIIPIFPLQGVLLFPGDTMPINIFEPRYLNMVRDALNGSRVIGLIQPEVRETENPQDHPKIYGTGCAGQIVDLGEAARGQLPINLAGLCRFEVVEELPLMNGYRRVRASYDRFKADTESNNANIDRHTLLTGLLMHVTIRKMPTDWEAIDQATDTELVNGLATLCGFSPQERQMLLEAPTLVERARIMSAMLHSGPGEIHGSSATKH